MTSMTFPQTSVTTLSVLNSEARFPVRRIYCVGRNYAAHSIEMGGDPDREEPFFFQKNPDNADQSGSFPYPAMSTNVHHEVELVVALKEGGTNIPLERALDHVFGYAVGIDMTRRDLQDLMKQQRRSWEIGKAFEQSAPLAAIVPIESCGHVESGTIALSVNGEERQQGNLNQMVWKVPEMIAYLSNYFALAPGDLLMTGTPAGVGPVQKGDTMLATIDGLGDLEVKVV